MTFFDETKYFDEGHPANDWRALIDFIYRGNSPAKTILLEHSRAVAELALQINVQKELSLDPDEVEAAAMLHDIGIIATKAPGIECHGVAPYICHGVIGADIIRRAGFSESYARVAERHTGSGISREDVERQQLPLPKDVDMMPHSTLERLICFADKFFSKRPGNLSIQKNLEDVRKEMSGHGATALQRFEDLLEEFDCPAVLRN